MQPFADRHGQLSPDRRELLELWLDREEAADSAAAGPFVPPRTAQEQALAAIWQEVLDAERVGIDDDYFALGGDSILAIVVVTKAQNAGIPLSSHDLFEAPTVRQLARRLHPDGSESATMPADRSSSPVAGGRAEISPSATLPLTPMQAGMLFHALSDPSYYVVQASCQLEGDVNAGDLARAWQVVIDRHPELRRSFRVTARGPEQVTAPSVAMRVETADWRQFGDLPSFAARLQRHLAEDRRRGIDPTVPPLLRVSVLQLSESRYQCVFTHHHLLLDGWSQQLVLEELLEVYDQLGEGMLGPAPARLPFAAYLDWLGRQDLPAAEAFWRGQLRGFAPTPVGGRDSVGQHHYELAETVLPAQTCAALASSSRRLGLTPSTIVLGGWALLLAHLGRTNDVAFGVTVSGRPPDLPGVEQALGMFINTLPARIQVRPEDEPLAWLRSIQRGQADLGRYHYSPLTLIERCAGTQPGTRLFDSIVVVENFPAAIRDNHATRRLRITDATASVVEGYPLVLEVRPNAPVRLRLRYDTGLVGAETAAALLDAMHDYVSIVTASRPGRVADLVTSLAEAVARHSAAHRDRARSNVARQLRDARREPVAGPREDR